MLKKLTLTIVLFLSILCLGGCNMEEEKDEVKEEKIIIDNLSEYIKFNGSIATTLGGMKEPIQIYVHNGYFFDEANEKLIDSFFIDEIKIIKNYNCIPFILYCKNIDDNYFSCDNKNINFSKIYVFSEYNSIGFSVSIF